MVSKPVLPDKTFTLEFILISFFLNSSAAFSSNSSAFQPLANTLTPAPFWVNGNRYSTIGGWLYPGGPGGGSGVFGLNHDQRLQTKTKTKTKTKMKMKKGRRLNCPRPLIILKA